ncbi:MAG: LysM peptidoglycan-binding domain-containing M23 family metallopeptidase [Candidatus Binatia bacterium]
MRACGGWVVVIGALVLAGCGGPAGLRHRVRSGENLFRIGKAYGVAYQELARVNQLADPNRIEVGDVIVIPHATRELPVEVITPERARGDRPALRDLPSGPTPFVWPVAGPIESGFGPRGDGHHDGVDITCAEGTPVRAARAGRVIYSDSLRGYGNLVILDHDQGYATVYAHNKENRVRDGDTVRQGDVIALSGESGKTEAPNLHFEVRQDNIARNPLFYLPPTPVAGGARGPVAVVEKAP